MSEVVTDEETEEAELLPAVFAATTLKVYAVPFVSPVTTIGLDEPVPVNPLGEDVTVYPVIAAPPFETGAVNETVANVAPDVALTPVGAPGVVGAAVGVMDVDGEDAAPAPAELVAVTLKV